MCNQVFILTATNSQDFTVDNIMFAAESEDAVNEVFNNLMCDAWNKADIDDKEFYKTYDNYVDAWQTHVQMLVVHPLPQPKPGE